ncbi:MAG TPA: dihydroneopterin aldolase [Candidatus Latescibacteria bacterium]|jgi:dihydroneopterin aldolase|nr:dihydroneopterin aldolase [Gemmatimonadota bacterium]MDP7363698.1 dihydroneopterin aldolase [Candidatus Latescibacterota bacterium]MDP7631813.1 dihydroneopterin aldolase [Candidatus Latescibacterota bacterium]MEE3043166.1 dihydroneopterin aldolase [Candidatus Latescibacterota bacterium]HCV22300.1 dihydroneopterin aldolase [Candidatus Latescibacterota bacterium]|tara:strand:- start:339 stop:710 length:372 start_codon:yes stop_codon:yes gene_type:complete
MTDRLRLMNLVFHAYHGLLPEEERLGQRFEVDVELLLDLAAAGRADEPQLTVDYTDALALVEQIVTQRRFGLVEALAEALAEGIRQRFSTLEGVIIRVRKPNPPVATTFDGLEVEIERRWAPS